MSLFRIKTPILLVGVILTLLLAFPHIGFANQAQSAEIIVREWELQWFNDKTQPERLNAPSMTEPWLKADLNRPTNKIPKGSTGAWIHISIPPTADWTTPGLLFSRIYGTSISVYHEGVLIYQSTRDFSFERDKLLLPLNPQSVPSELYLRITSQERAGLNSSIRLGSFEALSHASTIQELPDLLLGSSIAFMAVIMLLVSGYLHTHQRKAWISLSLMALAVSIMIITYSTFLFTYFKSYGKLLQLLFDLSMIVVFPALHLYAGTVFEGKLTLYRRFGQWFVIYNMFCFMILLIYNVVGEPLYVYYKLFTFTLLAPILLIHLMLVIGQSIVQAIQGNKNGSILIMGFAGFAIAFGVDLYIMYTDEAHPMLYFWKIGVMWLILSFVVVLARRISADRRQLLAYSEELELFNHQLQRTEKMKFVSELAASIAHEVRNPLQVTRGFLQFISGKSNEASKSHFSIAIDELDRASMMITDFLTFAKPDLDSTIEELNLQQEMAVIETIMSPLAAMRGTILQVEAATPLYVMGSSAKFKQAVMNIIKNSIEAIHEKKDGMVSISTYESNGMAGICISDNGEGMDETQLAKLGEPYYSTKNTGTGLGLMVTFRIIEIMNGTVQYHSKKGQGTEALVLLPLVHKP
ncbi:sensor histidine kinase [Paenibacillus xylaniclasticus]|uniref:sensor histidine kinase n=1 Tax=Paenibacillus xylaniclasticus TaxID=588083 RepID=UPI000FDC597A|nr:MULTISPECIES: sensor histidine kinase [Paenibacillus]GFN34096.1 hypothetical protein PCURB6_43560 [Paenibacillus curdlanolyticus]